MAKKKPKKPRKRGPSLTQSIAAELEFRGLLNVNVRALPFGRGWVLSQITEVCQLTRRGIKWTIHWPTGGQRMCDNLAVAIQMIEGNLPQQHVTGSC